MAEKRPLPVINSAPPPPRQPGGDVQPEAAWHWIPLGAMISIAVGVVLARSFWMPFRQRLVSELYGGAATREEILRADARLSQSARDAVLFKIALAGALVALVSVVIGGFIVGRFGEGTNRRRGPLAGLAGLG